MVDTSTRATTGVPAREVIIPDLDATGRWHEHDYPHPLARWHTHPEVEIHLIRASRGLALVGDYVGAFGPGHVALVGSGLPHNWISDLTAGETIRGRDVVLQLDPQLVTELARHAPEFRQAQQLFLAADRGIEFTGATAQAAAEALESIGRLQGLSRLQSLVCLLSLLASAPEKDRRTLASRPAGADLNPRDQARIDSVFAFVSDRIDQPIRMTEVAELVGMTPTAFSRFFRTAAGRGFSATLRRLRIVRACQLLAEPETPVVEIAYAVGYLNLSNFNRQFRAETGTTPSAYRRILREPSDSPPHH